ncbi:uncharacterized protein BP01DRAFT_162857 [Aspergillus saccharolyticus JOP 1030-1]|uniref:Uncharacterized protein n=1 Tax=Aspergillus saccharolyticus JOP 1030-1 TaxID=1450539 RepID=A0A318ZAD8_9EURO|nr:hypothetical protein BP01DRAFT_162857 [Aspergillus saccharolyticus JOP 1030-1]PYH41673.1 hypothetical protein BP01DRAFT_162857 [Aspergillus saccharolyticus JOP 1030-1]
MRSGTCRPRELTSRHEIRPCRSNLLSDHLMTTLPSRRSNSLHHGNHGVLAILVPQRTMALAKFSAAQARVRGYGCGCCLFNDAHNDLKKIPVILLEARCRSYAGPVDAATVGSSLGRISSTQGSTQQAFTLETGKGGSHMQRDLTSDVQSTRRQNEVDCDDWIAFSKYAPSHACYTLGPFPREENSRLESTRGFQDQTGCTYPPSIFRCAPFFNSYKTK